MLLGLGRIGGRGLVGGSKEVFGLDGEMTLVDRDDLDWSTDGR
jgi:hypothetical protein